MGENIRIEEEKEGWAGCKIECLICTHWWIAVFHVECEKLECPNCHHMVNYKLIEK